MSIDWGADPSAAGGIGSPGPDPVVAAVCGAIAALQDSDPAGLTPTELGDRVVRVEQALAMLSSHQVACVQTMDARGDAAVLGFRTTASWLRAAPG